MAPQLDTRFLRVHPATARWWAQRDQCRTCRHHDEPKSTRHAQQRGELCLNSPDVTGAKRYEPCIDARALAEERDDQRAGLCGPDAVMWEAKP
jgi:hypothetical protein